MADFNVSSFSSGSNPLDGGSSTGGNITGSNSNTFDDTSTSYQGRSSSTGGGLGQSPWGRLSEVGITDLGTLFSGVGSESGGGNPFANNPAAAQVLFGGDSQGGSPFSNLRSNIDKLVGNSTNGSNPMSGSGSTNTFAGGGISAQSPGDDTSSFGGSSIPSFGGDNTNATGFEMRVMIDNLVTSKLSESGINVGVGGVIPIEGGNLSDPFAPGGSNPFGIPSDDTLGEFGIPSDGSFGGGSIPSFGGGGSIPSFGGGGSIPSFGGGNPFA